MGHGFVYVLANQAMKGIYKVGFTERDPFVRCEELSRATSVPAAFDLVCFAEYENAQARERIIHRDLAKWRMSQNREFFRCDLWHVTRRVMDVNLSAATHELDMRSYLYRESPLFREIESVCDFISRDCGFDIPYTPGII